MYNYQEQKKNLFTEEGQIKFLKVRDAVYKLLNNSRYVIMQEVINEVLGDAWMILTCVDRLVEIGELKEIKLERETFQQDRVFTKFY